RLLRERKGPPTTYRLAFHDRVGKVLRRFHFVAFTGQFTYSKAGCRVGACTSGGYRGNVVRVIRDGNHAVSGYAQCLKDLQLVGASHNRYFLVRLGERFEAMDVIGVTFGNKQAFSI